MSNFNDIKKRLSMSTTMPLGTGGESSNAQWMMGSGHTHEHNADGSCCGHDHSHEQEHKHTHEHSHDGEEECGEDNTNPSGGCGCC